jgi:HlyD family secretion protein
MKMKIAIVAAVVAVALAGGGVLLSRRGRESGRPAPTLRARRGDLVEVATASGTVEPDVQVEVKSRASGEVVEVLVDEGDQVEAGQLLVKLDPIDAERQVRDSRAALSRAEADLAQARAGLSVAQAEAEEAEARSAVRKRGAELGLISAEDQRTASSSAVVSRANVELKQAQIRSALSQVESARLTVDEARRRLAEMEIRAPISGTVLAVTVERGSIVSSGITTFSGGTALLTLADLTELLVYGQLDEAQIGRVREGQEVTVRVDAYPDRTFEGRVRRVSPLGQETSNVVTFRVEIAVTDREAGLLRSGMSADLEIVTGRHQGVVLVPLTAIRGDSRQRLVLLSNGRPQPIRTGATDGTDIVVLEGLAGGEELQGSGPPPSAPRQQKTFFPMGPPRRPTKR